RLRVAYERRRRDVWPPFVDSLFDRVAPSRGDRARLHLLDVGSATGQLSIRAVQAGFGRVTSSEIRGEQVEQQRLLFECLRDPVYRERIRPVHDTTSADATAFPERSTNDPPGGGCCFGPLYHLAHACQ